MQIEYSKLGALAPETEWKQLTEDQIEEAAFGSVFFHGVHTIGPYVVDEDGDYFDIREIVAMTPLGDNRIRLKDRKDGYTGVGCEAGGSDSAIRMLISLQIYWQVQTVGGSGPTTYRIG